MRGSYAHRQLSRLVVGAFIIAVGVFALLDNLNLFDARLVQPFWPLVFVAIGGLRLARLWDTRAAVLSLVWIAVGLAMTANNLGLIHFHVRDWWPVLLIAGGLSVILRGFGSRGARGARSDCRGERLEHGSRIEASAVMSGIVLRNDSQEFQGGEIEAIMGSIEIDLRQASIVGEARLHLSIVMGGVEIKVPRDWSISVNGTPTLGGIEDKTIPPMVPGKRLVIDGSVVMGGVEIVN